MSTTRRDFPSCCASPWSAPPQSRALLADAGCDSADNRWLCLRDGIRPVIRHKGVEHGSGLRAVRSIVENVNAWLLNNKPLDRRQDRSAGVIQSLLTTACIFVIANRVADL
jgi:hypothetical protein